MSIKLKPINFIGACDEVYGLLVHCIVCGFDYKQTNEHVEQKGYLLPLKQFEAMSVLIDTQMELDFSSTEPCDSM